MNPLLDDQRPALSRCHRDQTINVERVRTTPVNRSASVVCTVLFGSSGSVTSMWALTPPHFTTPPAGAEMVAIGRKGFGPLHGRIVIAGWRRTLEGGWAPIPFLTTATPPVFPH
jgi:hypothetical protein